MVQCNRFDDVTMTKAAVLNGQNRINFSALRHCELEGYTVDTYSIKYILEGTEHYFLKRRRFSVSAGQFLLVNSQQPIDVLIRSRKKVVSLCIHLEENLLRETYAQLQFNDETLLDEPQVLPSVPPLEEIIYSDTDNALGDCLRQMALCFNSQDETIAAEPAELYYRLSRHLLQVQNNFPRNGRSLGLLRNSTRQELVRRLRLAKDLLDAQETEGLNMEAVAKQCALSGAHFFRSFKKLYGLSPYQYLLQQKLESAASLLKTKKLSTTETALHCGFSDLPSFSKAFKRHFGFSPAGYLQQCNV